MKHDVLQVLGASLQKVMTTHSSYIGSADCNWEDIAAQLILHCDGKLAIMSEATFQLIAGDAGCDDAQDEPVPYALTEKDKQPLTRCW